MKKTAIITAIAAALLSCSTPEVKTISVVPYPNQVNVKAGAFNACGASFSYDAAFDQAAADLVKGFAQQLSLVTGCENVVAEGSACKGFVFKMAPQMGKEAYKLNVTKNAVKVYASSLSGVNYAIQTLKQMLPVEIFGKAEAADADWTIQCAKIYDEPRFGYRGMHLDESRHFFGKEEVKKYLDIMEVHKLNTLHWHLTDDQGWRLEIKKYPRLTEVGSIRNQTLIGHGSNGNKYDNTRYGEGCWYSQEDVKEILAYAASKGITIIPEIDLPGHMLAALTAYPEYGCTGGPYEVWGRWGIADDVLCAGKEETMLFLEDVLAEVCELFPAEYIHIGGDECPKVRWETCPHCQAKIAELGLKDTDEFQAEHYLQSYVMTRMTNFLSEKGKKIIGWDEILEGEVAEDAIVMSWRGVAGGLQAVRMGNEAIMTPNTFYYLDYYQSLDQENEPLAIGGYLPVEKCYSYEPFTANMTDEEKARILGVQANLWTEYIATPDHLHYMLLPRMAALSEVQWCQADNKSWERFYDSADEFCAIYDIMGYKYGTHIFDTRGICQTGNGVSVVLEAQGETPIHYTLDGSDPTPESLLYTEPVKITESCTIKARSLRGGQMSGRTFEKSFTAHKAMGRPVKMVTATHPNYTFNCPDMLTDGLTGEGPYNSGDFGGWYNQPFEVIVDMGGETYSEATLSTIVFKYDWIMNPTSLTVLTSEDGETFTDVAHMNIECEGQMDDANGCQDYKLAFGQTSAKYLKVIAGCCTSLPQWHTGAGHPAFLFVDEILVN